MIKNPDTSFAEVLSKLRKKAGMSQDQLAAASGLDRSFISLLERGVRQPSLRSTIDIAKGLGITASEFVEMVTNQNK
jgi:transcriptional regulator with XRE-family HTH domain